MFSKKSGQAIVEYAILLGLISILSISALSLLGKNTSATFDLFNRTFESKKYKEIEVFEYKINDCFLGFKIPSDMEENNENISIFIIGNNGINIELKKGGNSYCPTNTYCPTRTDYNVQYLISQNSQIVVKSNNKELVKTYVWDFN